MQIVSNVGAQPPVMDEAGERIFELLTAQNHSIIQLELEPGAKSPAKPHYHKQSEETYVVLSGAAEIIVDDEIHPLAAGDIACAAIGEMHQITAIGHEPLVALAIMAPGFNPDDVFE